MSVRKTAAKFEVNPSTVQRIARPSGRRQRKAPGEQGSLNRGLKRSRGVEGQLGNAASIISLAVICSSQAKGAQEAGPFAPLLSFPKCPHTRKEKISNSDDKIAAGLGQEGPRRIPHNGRISRSHVAIFVFFCREVVMANANVASMSVMRF